MSDTPANIPASTSAPSFGAIIIGAVALPMMLEKVAAQDYPDLARRGGGSNLGSLWNALKVGLGFVAMLLLSLPLWLLPGAGLLISLVLTAWLNQRAFAYDALMVHADAYELKTIPRQHHGKLFTVGLAGAVLAAYGAHYGTQLPVQALQAFHATFLTMGVVTVAAAAVFWQLSPLDKGVAPTEPTAGED